MLRELGQISARVEQLVTMSQYLLEETKRLRVQQQEDAQTIATLQSTLASTQAQLAERDQQLLTSNAQQTQENTQLRQTLDEQNQRVYTLEQQIKLLEAEKFAWQQGTAQVRERVAKVLENLPLH